MYILIDKPEYLHGQCIKVNGVFWNVCFGQFTELISIEYPSKQQLIFAERLDKTYDLLGLIIGTPFISYEKDRLVPYFKTENYKIFYFTDSKKYRVFDFKAQKVFTGRYKELVIWLKENI